MTILFELDKLVEMTTDATQQLNITQQPPVPATTQAVPAQRSTAPAKKLPTKFAAPQTAPYPEKPVGLSQPMGQPAV